MTPRRFRIRGDCGPPDAAGGRSGRLLHAFRQFHEGRLQVHLFFAEQQHAELPLEQELRQVAVVLDARLERHVDRAVLGDRDRLHEFLLLEQPGGLVGAVLHADLQRRPLAGLLHDLVDVAVREHHALLDDADAGADVGQFRQDVARHDHGLVHSAQPLEQVPHLDAGAGVEAAGRLVEQQDLRIVQQRAGQADPLRLPATERVDHRVALEAHVDQVELLLADLPPAGAVDAVGGGEEFEVLDDGHVVVHAEEVGHVADQPPDLLRMRVDALAADVGFAVVGLKQRGDHPHRGRLARAVRADESEDVAFLERKVDLVRGDQVAVAFGELAGFDHAAAGGERCLRTGGLAFGRARLPPSRMGLYGSLLGPPLPRERGQG